jgi:ferredoxin-NADP reductase/DMSO/TMAO reductase YedYZ heme-binding membrane subunit
MNEPQIWWYVTRSSAIIAWVLMTFAVVWGVLLSTRVMRKIDNPSWLQDLHRYLGGVSLIMVLLHMVSLMLDEYAHFTVEELLVPFAIEPRFAGMPIALGILAFYLMVAVQGSSYLVNRIPRKVWKAIHYASYVALIAVSFHAGFSSSQDVSQLWYKSLAILLVAIGAGAAIVRILVGSRTSARANSRSVTEPASARANLGRSRDAGAAPGAVTVGQKPGRRMRVVSVEMLTPEVKHFVLEDLAGETLPVWHPGAHLTLNLADGRTRQYSLCGDPADRTHFEIAVLRIDEPGSGSSWIHENLRAGSELDITDPRNHFELEPANRYTFIAGGIGITPIKAMIESLPQRREWELHYFGRSRTTMAFLDELLERYPDKITVWARDELGNKDARLTSLVEDPSAQVYCCGPESLMSALAIATPAERLHLERFVAVDRASSSVATPVNVTCRKSKVSFIVPEDQTILDALEEHGVPIIGSCRKGVCGTCEVRVKEGTPTHLDSVMSDEEKDELGVMYPCVSRASTPSLVLDV